jgi:hypothetical protein
MKLAIKLIITKNQRSMPKREVLIMEIRLLEDYYLKRKEIKIIKFNNSNKKVEEREEVLK